MIVAEKSLKIFAWILFWICFRSNTDSLSQLAELISKGDEKGIFRRMGFVPEIEQIVKAENLEFCRNRAIYEPNYLNFIFNMSRVFKELDLLGENRYHDSEMFAFEATNLSLEFLYNTYFKIGKKLRFEETSRIKQ